MSSTSSFDVGWNGCPSRAPVGVEQVALPSTVIDCDTVPITAGPREDIVSAIVWRASRPRVEGTAVHLCNAYVLAMSAQEPGYRALFSGDAVNLADGAPVAWAVRYGGAPEAEQIRGTDLVLDVIDRGRDAGLRHYLLGGAPRTVTTMAERLTARFPGMQLAGTESPPFRPLDEAERAAQAARIVDSGADVVWVGLGTPKQDYAVADLVQRTRTVAIGVGAAFDFLAGEKAEAPVWMQRAYLEWLHRFAHEPGRLWKRYLVGNSRFVYGLLRHPPRMAG